MLFRPFDMALTVVIVAAAAMTYKIKHDAEDRLAEIRKLRISIQNEQDTIDVLKADWSILTQPARLQQLAGRYAKELPLQPLDARAIVGVEDLPKRETGIEDIINGSGTRSAGAGGEVDGVVTGGTDR